MDGYFKADRQKVVVCDNGTGVRELTCWFSICPLLSTARANQFACVVVQLVKCGFAGDNFPRSVFPCMIGRPVMRFEDQLSDITPMKVSSGQVTTHRTL
jgi:hypothetical protein